MDLPMNLFYWLMSIVPILLLIVFMIILQWGALKAAPITLVISIILGVLVFQGNFTVIGIELLRASWSSLSIILVILSAIILYEVSNEVNAFSTLNYMFKTVAPNELVRVLLIGVVFASFLQGVTGFGVPVLVSAPLLIQIGMKPMFAVIVPLVGHSWAGTFGTLAIAWDALIEQITGNSANAYPEAALYTGIFLFILTLGANFLIAYQYGKGEAVKKGFVAILLISIIQGGGQLIVGQFNTELASFLPSAITMIATVLLSKTPMYSEEWSISDSKIMEQKSAEMVEAEETEVELNMSIFQALIPYILMTIITLAVLLIAPINNLLSQFSIGPNFIETETGFGFVNAAVENYSPLTPFTHASMFLFLAAVLSFIYYRQKGLVKTKNPVGNILSRTGKRALSPSIAVISLLAISRVMAGTGQTLILAQGITNVLGTYYTFVSPFIGLLGSFITGSNMSSNILFGQFQYLTAEFIGLNVPAIVGAQTSGGAIGMALAPGNIVLGTSAVGALGSEGKVMRMIIPFSLTIATIIGLILMFVL